MSCHMVVDRRSSSGMAARNKRLISLTPLLLGRAPNLLRRPMRSNSISSCPFTTCQGSAWAHSATRRRRVESSIPRCSAASTNNPSTSTVHDSSSTKRLTGSEAMLRSISCAAHLRRPENRASTKQGSTNVLPSFLFKLLDLFPVRQLRQHRDQCG